jgi:hypothetical protein
MATPPAYTVPALPGLLAPQLRVVVLHERGEPSSVVVLHVEGDHARLWDGSFTAVGFWRVDSLHLDLRDRLTAAHVAWWARPLSHAEFNPDDYDRVDRR